MSAPTPPLTDDEMLAAVTSSMVVLHERYHHRKPVSAKTQLLGGDLLVCVLAGVYTDVEKTLIELQHSTTVQETRSEFQVAMQHKFIARGRAPDQALGARVHLQQPRRPGPGDRAVHARPVRCRVIQTPRRPRRLKPNDWLAVGRPERPGT